MVAKGKIANSLWFACLALVAMQACDQPGPRGPAEPFGFTPLRAAAVSVDGGLSRGAAWGDFDGNGFPDLVVANTIGQPDLIYANNGDGTFSQMHENALTLSAGWSEGIKWVDYDNDGDLDLFVARTRDSNLLLRNDDGLLVALEADELTAGQVESSDGCWGDVDGDGFLDVLVANRGGEDDVLYRNNGQGGFERLGVPAFEGLGGDARACAFGDADGDGDLDLYIGNFIDETGEEPKRQVNFLFLGDGKGGFKRLKDHALATDAALTYGLSWVDFDGDGDLDLFITNIGLNDRNRLFENLGNLRFAARDDLPVSRIRAPSKGHSWGDFDNDGDLDLFVANGTEGTEEDENYDIGNFLYLGDGKGGFIEVTSGPLVEDRHISAGAALADFDRDGDLDIFVANWAEADEDNVLYRNDGAKGNWLELSLEGRRSNRMGIGAFVTLSITTADGPKQITRYQMPQSGYGSADEPVLHFGLGPAGRIGRLEIRWPSGVVDIFEDLAVNAHLLAAEGAQLVPFIYATEKTE